jgi:hypothetical protein
VLDAELLADLFEELPGASLLGSARATMEVESAEVVGVLWDASVEQSDERANELARELR